VTSELADLVASRPRAVIVANAARDHARAVEWALDARLPTLVEKPFTDSADDTARLVARARRDGTPLCAAHVMMFAGYLESLARRVSARVPDALRIEWRDPREEVRHGERKRFDASVPVYLDCLPHVVSVLSLLWPRATLRGELLDVERGGARVRLQLRVDAAVCEVTLERNAAERARRITLEGTPAVDLDFTREPGELRLDGIAVGADPDWSSRPRPMTAMVAAFIAVVAGATPDPRLDADIAVHAGQLIDWAAPLYNSRRLSWLEEALVSRPDSDDESRYALAELLQSRGRLEPELLEATARRLHELFRVNPDPAWLAGLVSASDPAEGVDTRGTAALRGLS
jgi:predicted dehydrogenase